MEPVQILLLEDSPIDADLTLYQLTRSGLQFQAARADARAAFESALRSRLYDLILADYSLPDFDGVSALRYVRGLGLDTPFIIVSGVLGEEHAIEALQQGATDYVLKSKLNRLGPAVERALAESRNARERRRAAEELERAQQFCRRILESSRDCIMTVSPAGAVLSVNPYGAGSLGLEPAADLPVLEWSTVWETEDPNAAQEALHRACCGQAAGFEGLTRTVDGEIRYWDVLVTPVLDADGSPHQILSVARDVTERRHAEEERRMLLARERDARLEAESKAVLLQQSIEDLEHFASIASHDLKEPLRTITMYCQMLLRHCGDTLQGDPRVWLGYVEQGTRRMSALLQDLLCYSRVVHLEDHVQVTEADSLIAEALHNCERAIRESGATVRAGAMPQIRAHRPQLVQVFQNLIENAVKYRGADPPVIDITCMQDSGEWLFCVSDNGIGFDRRHSERIFGLFKRLHGQEYPGTGIGLAICRRVVERHRGRIWAESEKGAGARFFFTLPLLETESESAVA